MRGITPIKVAVAATAIALFATGCQKAEEPEAKGGGELRIYSAEPSSLLPGKSDDAPSINIIRQLYVGLAAYETKSGAVKNVIAESITSTDNKVWEVKLKQGWKFQNGEAVTADSFINAWNATAYGPNAMNNSPFLSNIDGYGDLQAEDPDGDGPQKAPEPKAKTMKGLVKKDDYSFTVTLAEPQVVFPTVVGYSGFFPLAKDCIADLEKCAETPIGNGPYKIEKWEHKQFVNVVRNDAYNGSDKGKSDKLNFKVYEKQEAAYADYQAGSLDIMEAIPAEKYKDATANYKNLLFEKPSDTYTYISFPLYLKNKPYSDMTEKGQKIRTALSMAIDRKAIIDALYDGRFSAAEGVVSPNFNGFRKDVCAACKYDPEKAKALLAEALPGGWPAGEKLIFWANAGVGHEKWLQAVGDQLKKNLGIDYDLKVDLQFAEYRATIRARKMTGPFRSGWGPDYPALETYLRPLYGTGGSSNDTTYTNTAFDDLMKQANNAKTLDEANKFWQQGEDIIVKELPVIPMWFGKVTDVYSAKVTNFEASFNAISGVEYNNIILKK